jgi:hypothetical protein
MRISRLLIFFLALSTVLSAGDLTSFRGKWKLVRSPEDAKAIAAQMPSGKKGFTSQTTLEVEPSDTSFVVKRTVGFDEETKKILGNPPEFTSEFTYRTDKKVKVTPSVLGEYDATTHWDGDDLVVDLAKDEHVFFIERWHLSDDKKTLTVTKSSSSEVETCTSAVQVGLNNPIPDKNRDCRKGRSEHVETYERLKK